MTAVRAVRPARAWLARSIGPAIGLGLDDAGDAPVRPVVPHEQRAQESLRHLLDRSLEDGAVETVSVPEGGATGRKDRPRSSAARVKP